MTSLDQAREELRLRQGSGARYDAPEAPAAALSLMRRGTAYFARKVNELRDAALYEPSRIVGWSRAHLICAVAYQARAFARQAEAATAGTPIPVHRTPEWAVYEDIELGATLPARALRYLVDHSAVHLDVVWRDLPGPSWDVQVPGPDGVSRPIRACVDERSRMLWLSAFDLNNGALERDLPEGMANAPRTAY